MEARDGMVGGGELGGREEGGLVGAGRTVFITVVRVETRDFMGVEVVE